MSCRNLVLILGDQLDRRASVLDTCDKQADLLLMIESRHDSQRIPSHKARTALFLAAMRHHAEWLRSQGFRLEYITVDTPLAKDFQTALAETLRRHQPTEVRMTEAGEFGVQQTINEACAKAGVPVQIFADDHFLFSREEFADWRAGRKTLVMETFYRHMRKRYDILMDGSKPVGGKWNLDDKNRASFGRKGPGLIPAPPPFAPDKITAQTLRDVDKHFPNNPGSLDTFAWPVTREQALHMLDDFVEQRLPAFGPFQDAMWTDHVLLHHSGLSAALNLKLLDPREVIQKAVAAYDANKAPLSSVEGFVRQVLGWREYVRGVYWSEMPDYLELNALQANQPLPGFYWHGDTDMHCLRVVIEQTLATGYAHHIQRLMVTGVFAMLLGVRPQEIHTWYLSVYIDAVEWVEAPNTLGMSQYADNGLLGSKPYAASGRYIQRMSNYCEACRYQPGERTGENACPFTVLYWDFLMRHDERFAKHPRAAMQWRMLQRIDHAERATINQQAEELRKQFAAS